MTSFVIIPHDGQNVNPQYSKTTAFAKNVRPAPIHTHAIVAPPTTQVTAKRCENYDPSPYATNTWTASRMSFEWHGDDVASFDDKIHALIERNAKEATFRPIDQPATRVIMCSSLLESIIARTTYNLASHNGEITFVNGKVHTGMPARFTFRAYTQDDGERVIQEKRGKKKWKHFGGLTPSGTVTPIIPAYLHELAADDDPRYPEAAEEAQRKIKVIQAKANLINDPTRMMDQGVAVNFKGSCRCCNRTLKNPKSVANGIGPTCALGQSQAAVATPTVHTITEATAKSHSVEDLEEDQQLPLDAEQVLFCTSQLGAMGCSDNEIEQFFDDLFPNSPYWYPNFTSEATK